MTTRRDFLKRLGGAAAAVALSPLLDLAPIIDAPSVVATSGQDAFVAWYVVRMKMIVDMPKYCIRLDGIMGQAMLP